MTNIREERTFSGEWSSSIKIATWLQRTGRATGLAGAAIICLCQTAAAEYRIQPGDTIEITVSGLPEIRHRSTVGIDGDIVVPLLGPIIVKGLSLSEARAKLAQQIPSKIYHQRTPDGRSIDHVLLPEEINVAIEYRPVYLTGDVARGGEQPFRPGMTVRQAIANAGGFDLIRMRMNNPVWEAADLKAENEALWTERARVQWQIWRLRTELGESVKMPVLEETSPVASEVFLQLAAAEKEQLRTRNADRDKERQYLVEQIKKSESQIGMLADKRKQDEDSIQADTADLENVRALLQRGNAATSRLSEARRAVLFSSSQMLQTIVETSQIERQRGEYVRQLDRLADLRKAETLRELQEATLRLSQINARLQGSTVKLFFSTTMQSELARGKAGHPDIVIHRMADNTDTTLEVSEQTELQPGDVVEVALKIGK